ncbi:helix-turn-helix domain-containing protein [Jiangella alba]|uniref:DNA binding domain-containing protein, excisionase family n=1 Tax=Jiangella alba TaxID=561176 RepID=A0A1H5MWP2_9ACTN|nr:helix-turn-helix domain-containing protein [Jiangella alba]SEE93779.1 DNA binding domain-containing protein, excisionase family [Jiangella alba]
MTEMLARDVEAVHRALDAGGDDVQVSLSRETAELLARVVDARARGQQVLVTRGHAEVTPSEAAELLGMSRPQVRKLMDQGVLDFRKVGAHHRIRVSSIRAFLDAERPRRQAALEDLADLQDELGLTE